MKCNMTMNARLVGGLFLGNGYRCHHANSPALLDACDELGVLILAETRQLGTSPAALEEWRALISRDRNHPSVFMWCVGNEENVVQQTDRGRRIAQEMVEVQRRLDPSRSVTIRNAQKNAAARPEFAGKVKFVETHDFVRAEEDSPTKEGYHEFKNGETYFLIGDALGKAMLNLLAK